MKKLLLNPKLIIFTLLFGMLSKNVFSQKVTKVISEVKIGFLDCTNKMDINVTNGDTTYYVTNYYQNIEYSLITDLGSLFYMSKELLNKTIEQIEMCLPYMDVKSDEFSVGNFRVPSYSKDLIINDNRGKYTWMSKKDVIKWLEWLKGTKLN